MCGRVGEVGWKVDALALETGVDTIAEGVSWVAELGRRLYLKAKRVLDSLYILKCGSWDSRT